MDLLKSVPPLPRFESVSHTEHYTRSDFEYLLTVVKRLAERNNHQWTQLDMGRGVEMPFDTQQRAAESKDLHMLAVPVCLCLCVRACACVLVFTRVHHYVPTLD